MFCPESKKNQYNTHLPDLIDECLPIAIVYFYDKSTIHLYEYDEFYYHIKNNKVIGIDFKSVFVMDKNFRMPTTIEFVNGSPIITTSDLSKMFMDCKRFNSSLNFNTENVIDMSHMFHGCENFNHPVKFNTENVIDMMCMFYGCNKFNQLVEFNTRNVTDMSHMFTCCSKFNQLLELDIRNVTDMSYMFMGCKNASLKTPMEF